MVIDSDYTYPGEHWVIYIIAESICCTPVTNIMYVNYTSIKKIFTTPLRYSLVPSYTAFPSLKNHAARIFNHVSFL